jgi:ABC-type transport system involved in cytochrome c biogenesis permease subunit
MKLQTLSIRALAAAVLTGAVASAQANPHAGQGLDPAAANTVAEIVAAPSLPHWDPELLELVGKIPVQDEGRIKPLRTFADFKLLQFNGKRSLSWDVPDGDQVHSFKRTSVEWLLDTILFPNEAANYPCFLLDTYEVADAIGVERGEKGKRDHWSYEQLSAGRQTLERKAVQLMNDPIKREGKNRNVVEEQILQLSQKIREFEGLLDFLDFARHDFPVGGDANARALFGGKEKVDLATLLDAMPLIRQELRTLGDKSSPGIDDARRKSESDALNGLLKSAVEMSKFSTALCLLPPPGLPGGNVSKENPWLTVPDVLEQYFGGSDQLELQVAGVTALDHAWEGREDRAMLASALTRLHDIVVDAATVRGEYKKIESEVAFYNAKLFDYALAFYILGFIIVAIGWMVRADSQLHRWLPLYMVIPLAFHVAGIVWRCYLRGRPPVSTLYETILFISAIAVTASLVLEKLNRRRIAVGFAALIGAFGLFLAMSYEAKEAFDSGTDTMPKLQAVLDTNYWLATHVTTVTIGYSAGLLAAFLAHVYVIGQLFGFRKKDHDFYRNVVRMVYGVLCFGLLFSVVGTILGGVWANDSWGRFWGWDPKENGALMICLWELAILHGRMGGYLRELGLCAAAIFNGAIVGFSWWHVNLLGVGLHAYGFTHGILGRLTIFYGFEALMLFAALYLWLDRRAALAAARPVQKPLTHGGA